jgi:phage-related protein (TIGR01555 family)
MENSTLAVTPTKSLTSWPKAFRRDGWKNILTNLGVKNRDKRTGSRVTFTFLTRQDADDFYGGDDVAERIVDRPAEEMMREGWKTTAPGQQELTEKMGAEFERLGIYKKIEQGLKWARQYGGAGMIVGLKDGLTPDQPVDFSKIEAVEYLTVLDCHRLVPYDSTGAIDLDVTSSNFGRPTYYKVENLGTTTSQLSKLANEAGDVKIHWSRIVRFEGREVPWYYKSTLKWWGNSVLAKLYNPVRNYQASNDSAALIVEDFSQMVIKLKNLSDMIAEGDEKVVQKRLELLMATSSIVNGLVIEEGEEIERKSTSVAGLPDLLKMINARLVAATDLPHTVLLGESPSGLGATGNSEKKDWYDHIKNKQESDLRPIAMQITLFLLASKKGPAGGKIPAKWGIEFNPLWQPSEKEIVETRKIQADTDKIYVELQTLDNDEVSESRWGSGKYSFETTLNKKLRTAIAAPIVDPKEDPESEEDPIVEPVKTIKAVEADPNSPKPDAPVSAQENQVTSPQAALTGVQVTSMLEIIGQVAEEKIPRETGVLLLQVAFALSPEKSEEVMGAVGKGFQPKVEPKPEAPNNFSKPSEKPDADPSKPPTIPA